LGKTAPKSQEVRNLIARASQSFDLKEGTAASDLVIENERLKTTLMILNQKLKMQNDEQDVRD
jgi:hypothetical protein